MSTMRTVGALFAVLASLAGPAAAQEVTPATRAAHARALEGAPDPSREAAFAERGFVATRADPEIRTADGARVVWDLRTWDYLKGPAPETVHPLFWRHNQILARHGLFRITDRIHQVRGFDAANITFVRGERGYVVIDALTTMETARAAYELVKQRLGDRPITALVYTHTHADHFGGARGLVDQKDVDSGRVPVIAPSGFLEHAVSENVLAGNAMGRRSLYQFGWFLPRGPEGQISSGVGLAISTGTQTLIPPTRLVARSGESLTVDGVRLEFQLTPGAEAPAEMNVFLPQFGVLHLAENANPAMHNLLPPRGALVRDAKAWADYLSEALRLYGPRTDVVLTGHGWPRWGREAIREDIGRHRDAYKFLHDQSVRLMNQGLTGPEIAERLRLPPALRSVWINGDFYGTLATNARAVYQRYMGWYDANPANLNPLPPDEAARRYVGVMGGPAAVLAEGRRAFDAGDYRWAAEVLNRLVFAAPDNAEARQLLARTYTQLGYQSQSGQIRNLYLTGAMELRDGAPKIPGGNVQPDVLRNAPTGMLLDLLAVRLNPERAGEQTLALQLVFPGVKERHLLTLRNGVLLHEPAPAAPGRVDATVTLERPAFYDVVLGRARLAEKLAAKEAIVSGDAGALDRLVALLDTFDGGFPIVTP